MLELFLPPLLIFIVAFFPVKKSRKFLPIVSFSVLLPLFFLFHHKETLFYFDQNFIIDDLTRFVLLISGIVAIGVTLALESLEHRVTITPKAYQRFYRFFALFWIGLLVAILANNMGLFWVGLEMATLSTVYMIKTNQNLAAHKEAWNYMIVGTIAISLILAGIILIYASAKPLLAENAMLFSALLSHVHQLPSPYLFELGFAFIAVGMFIKMGFFPMNLWLANIERASFYPVAALFSGILESAIVIGFFRFSKIAQDIDMSHLIGFSYIYAILTLFIVSFLIFRAKDFMRLFALSSIEHMVLIALFWVSGGYFAALLHLAAHAFLKPALFIVTGVLESGGKYHIAGALKGYNTKKGKLFALLVGLFLLAIIALPPSPIFLSELYGFGAMIDLAEESPHLLAMIGAILLISLFLSIIFYKFVEVYQSMKYEGEAIEKRVYVGELGALILFAVATATLLMPEVISYIKGIA